MKNKITTSIVTLSLILTPLTAFSGSGIEKGTGTAPAQGTQNNQPSIKDGADQSKSGNGFAQAMNYVVGGAEVAMGGFLIKSANGNGAQIAAGVMMIAMGLTNLAQGSDHGGAAGSAGVTGFQTDGFGGLTNPDGSSDPYVKAALTDPNYKAVGSTLKQLAAQGVYNPKTGEFKIGDKTYKSSDFASAGSMAAAGLPQGMIDGAMAANADAEKKALAKLEKVKIGASTAANGYEEGGGGGGGMGSGVGGTDDGSSAYAGAGGGKGLGKTGLERDPSSLAGMSKNYNGEPIGVAADSIFLMMSRRYKVKESQESFFSPADLALQK